MSPGTLRRAYLFPGRHHAQVTIDQVIGGARGIKSMIWETSNLDADEVCVCVCKPVGVVSEAGVGQRGLPQVKKGVRCYVRM